MQSDHVTTRVMDGPPPPFTFRFHEAPFRAPSLGALAGTVAELQPFLVAVLARSTYNQAMADHSNLPFTALAEAVGRRVEQERERRALTKEALAERAEMASRYLWRVENGRQNVTLKNLLAIAHGLGMTASDLLAGVEEMARNPLPKAPRRTRRSSKASRDGDDVSASRPARPEHAAADQSKPSSRAAEGGMKGRA